MNAANDIIKSILAGQSQEVGYVTSRHTKWLAAGANFTNEAMGRIAELVIRDGQDADRKSSGEGRIRPSLSGDRCLRKQRFSYEGKPSEPLGIAGAKFTTNGTFGHYRWQAYGLSAGWLEDIEVSVETEYGLKGSADGILADGAGVFEFKTTNTSTLNRLKKSGAPDPGHVLQATGYMDALGLQTASIVYEAREWMEFFEFRVSLDQELLQTLKDQCQIISSGLIDLPPLEDCVTRTGRTFEQCSWRNVCKPENYVAEHNSMEL